MLTEADVAEILAAGVSGSPAAPLTVGARKHLWLLVQQLQVELAGGMGVRAGLPAACTPR